MAFLKFLEGIRNPFFDWFFSLITHIGDETVFLVIALIVFWCVSKREGYYLLFVGFFGQVINNLLKLIFRIPRPFIADKTITPVESAVGRALGYSFPSGHTQNIAGTLGVVTAKANKKWLKGVCIALIVLVAFSRMYLGVHTPLDVVVSLGIALVLVLALYPMFKTEERFERFMPYLVIASILFSLVYLLCLKRKWLTAVIGIPVLVLFAVITYSSVELQAEKRALEKHKQELEEVYQTQQERSEELEKKKAHMQTFRYIEEIARKVLGLVFPDETILRPEEEE